MSRLQGNAVGHPLPEVLSKVHLGLGQHLVDDGSGDPALPTAPAHEQNGHVKEPGGEGGGAMPLLPLGLC